jgi:hypothetical protein
MLALDYRALAYEILSKCGLAINECLTTEGIPDLSWFRNANLRVGLGVLSYRASLAEGITSITFTCYCAGLDSLLVNQKISALANCLKCQCQAYRIVIKSSFLKEGVFISYIEFSANYYERI